MSLALTIESYKESSAKELFETRLSQYSHAAQTNASSATSSAQETYLRTLMNFGKSRRSNFWIASEKATGKVVARIGCDLPSGPERQGSVGFFDCDLNESGHTAGGIILQSALSWLQQHGAQRVVGPMDFNSWFQYRFKVRDETTDATDHPWEPSAPASHHAIFAAAGFKEHLRFSSFFFTVRGNEVWDGYIARLEPQLSKLKNDGFVFRDLAWKENLAADLKTIFDISNESFRKNPMFEDIPLDLFMKLTASSAGLSDVQASSLCFSPTGEPAGFIFAFIKGDLVVYKTVAVRPQFQELGLANAMTCRLCQLCRTHSVKRSVGALIRKGNESELIGRGFSKFALSAGNHDYILLEKDFSR